MKASSQKQEHLSKETIYEIRHLSHLLYLPFLTNEALSTEGWLYFEQQQQWLEIYFRTVACNGTSHFGIKGNYSN